MVDEDVMREAALRLAPEGQVNLGLPSTVCAAGAAAAEDAAQEAAATEEAMGGYGYGDPRWRWTQDPGQRDPGQRDPGQRDPGQRDPGAAAAAGVFNPDDPVAKHKAYDKNHGRFQ